MMSLDTSDPMITAAPDSGSRPHRVELAWIPLGAGSVVVKVSGTIFETLSALLQRRPRFALFHSALLIGADEGDYVVEMAPEIDRFGDLRGVVATGPVGVRLAGRFRLFRYEIRRWQNGSIPDLPAAKQIVPIDLNQVQIDQLLAFVALVPTPVWGRDQMHAGEMWNSNSVISWCLSQVGIDTTQLQPPMRGRAPGWTAGSVVASRAELRLDRVANV
jgi:hypothetical protein